MTARAMVLVVALRVRHQQALHDAADRRSQRADEQVKVVVQQAIAIQREGLALFELGQGLEKGRKVGVLAEHLLPVVAPIDHMIDQTIAKGSERAGHSRSLAAAGHGVN
jgi:hypothetical protein